MSLAAARGQSEVHAAGALLMPFVVASGLKFTARHAESGKLPTSLTALRLAVVGVCLFLAAAFGPVDSAALRAASAVGLGLVTSGALLGVARLNPPPGLLQGHPTAESLDVVWLASIMWCTAASAAALRAIAPDEFPIDPLALDTAFVFCALGSLLLLCAALLRARLLRGLELGVGDRIQASLSLCIAGTIVGAGSGFVQMGSPDRVSAFALATTGCAVTAALSASDPGQVTKTVRALLALLLLGTPAALLGAHLASRFTEHAAGIALGVAAVGMAVGLAARSLASPLGPAGSRWLSSIEGAMVAALHPEPETALRRALTALRKAEPNSRTRPELFSADPPLMTSVDIAGYLSEREVEFPQGVVDCAADEPARTLRLETILSAQIRKPQVRSLVTWFEAHESKTATVLSDESGPIALLSLPRGKRNSPLTSEEAELLSQLAERLAGLVSVTSALHRARDREQRFQKQAESANEQAIQLSSQLKEQQEQRHVEAESLVAILRAAAHGPHSQITKQELALKAQAPRLTLTTPLGVDPVPWAAYAHLNRDPSPRPLVVIDLSEAIYRDPDRWENESKISPWSRALGGTLVLCHPSALSEDSQLRLCEALDLHPPPFVIVCRSEEALLLPRLERLFTGPHVVLPRLEDRGEDLQALILNELSQLGLTRRGAPYGAERAALHRLIQRSYPGNDAELRGTLASAVARASGDRITLDDLDERLEPEPNTEVLEIAQRRTRSRPAPRSRRR